MVQGDVSLYRLLPYVPRRATGRKREREIRSEREREEGREKKYARTYARTSGKVCVGIRTTHVDVTYVLYVRM